MDKWYQPYLGAYNIALDQVPEHVFTKIRSNLQTLSSTRPLLSIVVIAYNEDRHLAGCLWSLTEQRSSFPMEIIVVNNHSTDRTEEILKKVGVTYYNEPNQGPGFARQCGLDRAKGEYLLCVDGDTLYPPYYVATHQAYLSKPGVSATFSLWSFLPKPGQSALSLEGYEALRDLYLNLQNMKRPELCVRGMVFSFRTALGRQVGFRTDIKRGEDGSMALGLKKFGKIVFIRSRKARAVTGQNTLGADGSLANSFIIRLRKAFRSLTGLFSKKERYEDDETNLINKNK
ncbi:glycosyltransferase family 2 protein [Sphingobacterium faecium]|uniref:glycosyltransferase family 2 protein n=1 Tax=Sphingobacterium faecium TaxID=34087 RepID=UPI0032096493